MFKLLDGIIIAGIVVLAICCFVAMAQGLWEVVIPLLVIIAFSGLALMVKPKER
jgi:hypothetical protein